MDWTQRRRGRRGFTLIELLTVIAIIAILTAILFPVIGTVTENMRQGRCSTNIKQIIQGMKMYKDDHGVYPEALFGVSLNGGPLERRLAFQYVRNPEDFTCPNAHPTLRQNDQIVVPTNLMTGQPMMDRYGRTIGVPARDTYSAQLRPNAPGGRLEWHYALKWTPANVTGLNDDKRQLYHRSPPEDTVVTFCLLHGIDAAGNPRGGHKAIVGFLSGRVENLPVEKLSGWPGPDGKFPWQVSPK